MISLKSLIYENVVVEKILAFDKYILKKYPQLEDFSLRPGGDNIISLSIIEIHEEDRGQGTGRRVMLELIDWATKNGFTLHLQVRDMEEFDPPKRLAKLRKFYTSLGFVRQNEYDFLRYPSTK